MRSKKDRNTSFIKNLSVSSWLSALKALCITSFLCAFMALSTCNSPEQKKKTDNDPNDYYENGQVRIEKIIEGDHEKWIFRNEDGSCWEEDYYKKGEKYREVGFYKNCVKSSDVWYKNGERHGKFTTWNEDGKLYASATYENGHPVGDFLVYDTSGNIIEKQYHVHLQTLDSLPFPFGKRFDEMKSLMKNVPGLSTDYNIEVAGKSDDYYFPQLRWGESMLQFNMRKKNDASTTCEEGEIVDSGLGVMNTIRVGMSKAEVMQLFDIPDKPGLTTLAVYTVTENKLVFSFHFSNHTLSRIHFSEAYTAFD